MEWYQIHHIYFPPRWGTKQSSNEKKSNDRYSLEFIKFLAICPRIKLPTHFFAAIRTSNYIPTIQKTTVIYMSFPSKQANGLIFNFQDACAFHKLDIQHFLRHATVDNNCSALSYTTKTQLKQVWDNIIQIFFASGRQLRTKSTEDGEELNPVIIEIFGVPIRVHSIHCAVAATLSIVLPLHILSISDMFPRIYATIAVLARWSHRISPGSAPSVVSLITTTHGIIFAADPPSLLYSWLDNTQQSKRCSSSPPSLKRVTPNSPSRTSLSTLHRTKKILPTSLTASMEKLTSTTWRMLSLGNYNEPIWTLFTEKAKNNFCLVELHGTFF